MMALDLSLPSLLSDSNNNKNTFVVDLSLPRTMADLGPSPPGSGAGQEGRRDQLHQLLGLGDSKGLMEDDVFPPVSTVEDDVFPPGQRKQLHQLLGLGDSKGLDKLLPNLDITAINLLCLARLQETAAALTSLAPALGGSRRPPPAHLPLFLGGHTVSSSCQGVRRNHRCEQPGCDKVN